MIFFKNKVQHQKQLKMETKQGDNSNKTNTSENKVLLKFRFLLEQSEYLSTIDISTIRCRLDYHNNKDILHRSVQSFTVGVTMYVLHSQKSL